MVMAEIKNIVKKKPDAEELYKEYADRIRGYLRCQIENPEDAEDLHSEIFEKAIRSLDSYDPEKASVSTWIYTIARNRVTDFFRTRRINQELSDELISEEDPFAEIYENETLEELAGALATLSEEERDVIILTYYEKYTLKQLCPVMDLTYGQIKRIHQKALVRMKEYLMAHGKGQLLSLH